MVTTIILIPEEKTSDHRPICILDSMNNDKILRIVPIRVPFIASLAFPMAWSDAVRGDCI